MMMIEPDPTDVRPTSSPPTSPTITVGMIRTANGGRLSRGSPPTIRASSERRPCSQALNTMALAASRSVHPRNSFVRFSTCSLSPTLWMMKTPAKAIGIDPMHSHPTSGQRTVPSTDVDPAADRLHHHRGDQVRRDGRGRVHPEEDHEDRRHQGAAAHPGHPDREPYDRTREDDAPVDVHRPSVRRVLGSAE